VRRGVCLWRRRGWVERGRREIVSLYFSTLCLFLASAWIVKGGMQWGKQTYYRPAKGELIN